MEGEFSWFEGRLRKRPNYRGEVTMNEVWSRQDTSRRRRRQQQKVHSDLYAGFNAEERTERAVPAMDVQRREVVNQEENERDDDAVATMVAENKQVENREKGEMSSMQVDIQDENAKQKEDDKEIGEESEEKQDVKESGDTPAVIEMIQEENQVTDQEVGGVIQEEHDQENEVKIETMNQENRAADNQEAKESNPVDNREVIVISDEEDDEEVIGIVDEENQADNKEGNGINQAENENNQGVIEAREVIEVDEENKVENYEPLPAMFQVNEPELPENRYRYVGIHDWPLTWTYEERMMWGLD